MGGVLFSYRAPLEQGGWLEGWETAGATNLFAFAGPLYSGWCEPKRAFHKVREDDLLTVWLLLDDEVGRGIVHVV